MPFSEAIAIEHCDAGGAASNQNPTRRALVGWRPIRVEYEGELGPPPADIDVLIVGDADPDDAEDVFKGLQELFDVEVNSVVVSRSEWKATKPGFLRDVKKGPLVRLPSHPVAGAIPATNR